MDDSELELLRKNPRWERLLKAYAAALTALKQSNPQSTGWVPRFREWDECAADELSALHGKLIAYGFLAVDLAAQGDGMVYQLTFLGRRAVQPQGVPLVADDEAAAA